MDIRNFFSPGGGKSKPAVKKDKRGGDENGNHAKTDRHSSKATNGEGDSHKKKRQKKGAIIFDSDSDEEEPLPKHLKSKKSSAPITLSDSDDDFKPKKAHKEPAKVEKKTAMSAIDFFGGESVRQKERKGSAVKRKAEPSPKEKEKRRKSHEQELQDDEDFEKVLMALDEKQPAKKAKTEPSSSDSLSSKLAAKKRSEYFVEDTPERPSKSKTHGTVHVSPPKHKKASPQEKQKEKTPAKTKKGSPVTFTPKSKDTPKSKVSPPKGKEVEKKVSPKGKETAKKTPEKKASPGKSSPGEGGPGSLKKNNPGYRSFLLREPPRTLGSKEVPLAGDNCLENLTFVITGILESFDRDEMKNIIEKYGGKVTGSLSKKTSYMVVGRDAGEAKLAKATQLKTTQLDEDGVLNLLRKMPGKKSKYEVAAEKESKECHKETKKEASTPKTPASRLSGFAAKASPAAASSQSSPQLTQSPQVTESGGESLMWVDKYKPTSMKQLIGQQGDKSNARKLLNWLKNWHKNISAGKKPAFNNRFSDDGAGYRAALLSGPPGIGKTTTATIVCKEAGFSFVELNASDKRSKRSLKEEVAEALNNHTLMDYFGSKSSGDDPIDGQRHCLIMDEVDGMAGNEDRGGMAELILLIKHTRIPIITMCNDRQHQKVRSLANHTFDLRFQRPRMEQIKSAMMSIAYKEGLKIPPPALNEVIGAANQDIRQVLHNLSMWTSKDKSLTYAQLKTESEKAKKDLKMGPFDVCREVFAGGEQKKKMTLNDKADLFFHDYSFSPLFVQENYINVTPFAAKGSTSRWLDCLSTAADSLADGDIVDKLVRGGQHWNLLPIQAVFSSVIPGEAMEGAMSGMISFPQWLGKNSSRNKTDRQLQELKSHMTLRVSADKSGVNLDYLPSMRNYLTEPLIRDGAEGVTDVIDKLQHYQLLREDYDSILEVTQWPNRPDPLKAIDSKVKAAFTRTYNKEGILTPYASGATKKGRGRGGGGGGEMLMEGEEGEEGAGAEEEDDEEKEDLSKDTMIKQKKASTSGKGKAVAATGKGKATKGKATAAKGKATAVKGRGGKGKKL